MARNGSRQRWCAVTLVSLLCCAGGWAAAQPAKLAPSASEYGKWSETEKWVWVRLKAGDYAVLDRYDKCKAKALDPGKDEKAEPHWLDLCRQISASFLHDLLTDARWKDTLPHRGVQIAGAHVVGNLDLANADLVREFWIVDSRIDGGVTLRRARTKSLIGLSGTFVRGEFDANSLNSESDPHAACRHDVGAGRQPGRREGHRPGRYDRRHGGRHAER
jgi:hypothetical protein